VNFTSVEIQQGKEKEAPKRSKLERQTGKDLPGLRGGPGMAHPKFHLHASKDKGGCDKLKHLTGEPHRNPGGGVSLAVL